VVLPECRAPWSFCVQRNRAVFHIVVQGTCWLDVKGTATPAQLSEGDFVVVTRGQPHALRDLPSTPADNFFEVPRDQCVPDVGEGMFRW